MVQCGSGLRFALETGECLRVLGYLIGEKFQRNETMQPRVFGLVDHSHTTTAQLLKDAVVRDGLAEQWTLALCVIILGAKVRQVNVLREVPML
jgi:hypothetical protein